MPLYDCTFLFKPHVNKENLAQLIMRVGKHVFARKGVLTDLKSFGTINLAYGIKKRDGKFYEGQIMQMSMMVPPSFHQELLYLNKDDRLLRWILAKHRGVKYGVDFAGDGAKASDMFRKQGRSLADEDEEDDDDEYGSDVEPENVEYDSDVEGRV